MASTSQQSTAHMGSSVSLDVVEIIATNRNPKIWKHYDLCLMSDGSQKAWCKTCQKLMGKDVNSTLKNHVSKYCVVLKSDVGTGQTSIGGDGGIWHYDVERIRDRMVKFVIQEALPFNHFDNPQFTALIREALQHKYKQVSRFTLKCDCLKMWKKLNKK